MKRKIFYVMVVALAVTLSSFTLPKKSATGQYYWFPLQSGSGWALPVSRLVYQTYDPNLCLNWGLGDYCSGAFTSYTVSGSYYLASGMEVMVDFEILF
ncbi:MAG TPA: hypothetical protein VNS58_06065 [Puia sp.]|nr:hypothetical protein [Puia sp.]